MNRKLLQVHQARPSRVGDGVKISRFAGAQMNRAVDPFLMTDEISSDSRVDHMGAFPRSAGIPCYRDKTGSEVRVYIAGKISIEDTSLSGCLPAWLPGYYRRICQ
jgi:hypothetical protein